MRADRRELQAVPIARATSLACVLIASCVIACGSPSPAPAEQAPEAKPRVIELGGRQLVVEDPGQAPRRQLIHAGAHQRRVQIGLSQRDPDEEGGKVFPTFFVLQLDWRGETPSEGPATHEFAIEGIDHPPDPRRSDRPSKPMSPEWEATTKTLEDAFSRVRGSVLIERGQPQQITSTRSALRLSPDPPVILELFLVPLPEVELGVGARWVTTDAKSKERREYVLTKLDETGATIELERGAVDKLLSSSLPLVRGRFELRATTNSDSSKLVLADPLPTHGELEFEVVFEVPGEAGKETVKLYQIVTLDTAP
jgi:hypothetical protein